MEMYRYRMFAHKYSVTDKTFGYLEIRYKRMFENYRSKYIYQ